MSLNLNRKRKNLSLFAPLTFIAFAVFLLSGPKLAFGATGGIENGITSKAQLLNVLNNIVTFIYEVFFIVAAMFILFSAFSFLTAAGDEEKVQSSKKKFFYALVAIVIALVSLGAATFISNTLNPSQNQQICGTLGIGENCSANNTCQSCYCYFPPVPPGGLATCQNPP